MTTARNSRIHDAKAQQRVALAHALDTRVREHVQVEIKQLQRRLGITVVYVTHDRSEALTMSDRIAVFTNGRIQQFAAPTWLTQDAPVGGACQGSGPARQVRVAGGGVNVPARALERPAAERLGLPEARAAGVPVGSAA